MAPKNEKISRTVLRFRTSSACKQRSLSPDLALGRCLATARVRPINANNATDYRMIPFALENATLGEYPPWLPGRVKEIPAACSRDYISSTYLLQATSQYEYYHFIYIVSRS